MSETEDIHNCVYGQTKLRAGALSTPPGAIAIGEIEAQLDNIREMLKRESLAIDFEDADPSAEETASYDGFRFIPQFKAVGTTASRVRPLTSDQLRFLTGFVERDDPQTLL